MTNNQEWFYLWRNKATAALYKFYITIFHNKNLNINKVIKVIIARLGLEPKLTVHETVVLTTTQSRFTFLFI